MHCCPMELERGKKQGVSSISECTANPGVSRVLQQLGASHSGRASDTTHLLRPAVQEKENQLLAQLPRMLGGKSTRSCGPRCLYCPTVALHPGLQPQQGCN